MFETTTCANSSGRGEPGIGLDRQLALRRGDEPAGQLDVLLLDRALDVEHRQPARRERGAVDPDPHGVAPLAADIDRRDAGHGREPVDIDALQELGQLERVERRGGDADPHDGGGVGVDLAHDRQVDALGQAGHDARDAVAHVGGGGVGVAPDPELDRHRGALVLARRGDLANALEPRDRAFDELGDAALDDLVRGALVGRVDRDDRRVDLRILAHGELHAAPASPPTMSSRLTTTENTGRRMKRSETCMARQNPFDVISRGVRRRRRRAPAGASRPSVRWSASAWSAGPRRPAPRRSPASDRRSGPAAPAARRAR